MANFLEGVDNLAARLLGAGQERALWSSVVGRILLVVFFGVIVYLAAVLFREPIKSKPIAADKAVESGLVYALPLTRLVVTARLDILHCEVIEVRKSNAPTEDAFASEDLRPTTEALPALAAEAQVSTGAAGTQVQLTTSLKVTVTPETVPDPDFRFVIPATALHHPLLGDQVSVGLQSQGLLGSVGYGSRGVADDFKATTSSIIQLARGALNFAASSTQQEQQEEACRGLPQGDNDAVATADAVTSGRGQANSLFFADVLSSDRRSTVWEPALVPAPNSAVKQALASKKVTFQLDVAPRPADAASETNGIAYRFPQFGTVRACMDTCTQASGQGFSTADVIAIGTYRVYFPGQEVTIPVERSWFGGHSLNLTFDKGGGLATYASTLPETAAAASAATEEAPVGTDSPGQAGVVDEQPGDES